MNLAPMKRPSFSASVYRNEKLKTQLYALTIFLDAQARCVFRVSYYPVHCSFLFCETRSVRFCSVRNENDIFADFGR